VGSLFNRGLALSVVMMVTMMTITTAIIIIDMQMQSTVRKKMATGTFTCNALLTKTLNGRIKPQRKIISHSNSTRAMLLV